MFVQSEQFIEAHAGKLGDSFYNDRHRDLKPDRMTTNPPFNHSDWRGALRKDGLRLAYGTPPRGNANCARSCSSTTWGPPGSPASC